MQTTAAVGLAEAARSNFVWGCYGLFEDGDPESDCEFNEDLRTGNTVSGVPAGKIMVVEYISGSYISGPHSIFDILLEPKGRMPIAELSGVDRQQDSSGDLWRRTVSQQVRF